MSLEASDPSAASAIKRSCATFKPTIWGPSFLQYASESMKLEDNMQQKFHQLKQEVKKKLISPINHLNLSLMLNFIDSVQRLGVSYHFEREIDEALARFHSICITNNDINITLDYDLHILALLFRLLRQQGYPISSDVFKKFKNEDGKFDEKLAKDVHGMLALYEAAQLSVHGENVLDEAIDFTCTHLKSLINQLSSSLAEHVNHCLDQPLHKGIPRIETRYYLSFYQQDPSLSDILLTFAKLDFNMLQKLHQKEVGNITKWQKKLDFTTNIPYGRDRLVECYFWPLAMSIEPQYSTERTIVGKLAALICLIDDTYDSYGTVEELELFTEAIRRWDINPIKYIPDCMKAVFEGIQKLSSDMKLLITEEETSSFVMQFVKRDFYNLVQAYYTEAKWRHEGYIPTYDEYKDNVAIASSTYPIQITFFCGSGKLATKEVFDWISSDPKIIIAVSLIGRLLNDMASHKFEQERGHVASGVECCMKQYGVSVDEAYQIIQKDILNCWKDINEECLKPLAIPKPVIDCVLNLARVTEVAYADFKDRVTNAELLKEQVIAVLVDPIAIEQHQ